MYKLFFFLTSGNTRKTLQKGLILRCDSLILKSRCGKLFPHIIPKTQVKVREIVIFRKPFLLHFRLLKRVVPLA